MLNNLDDTQLSRMLADDVSWSDAVTQQLKERMWYEVRKIMTSGDWNDPAERCGIQRQIVVLKTGVLDLVEDIDKFSDQGRTKTFDLPRVEVDKDYSLMYRRETLETMIRAAEVELRDRKKVRRELYDYNKDYFWTYHTWYPME
ncbi:MAG: hypothetical protein HQ511_04080, partial [Rhodospirillales bacterium]|nr:hypothetical protein [Rhodospirillales bacterium]